MDQDELDRLDLLIIEVRELSSLIEELLQLLTQEESLH